jgi:hypothetical protein
VSVSEVGSGNDESQQRGPKFGWWIALMVFTAAGVWLLLVGQRWWSGVTLLTMLTNAGTGSYGAWHLYRSGRAVRMSGGTTEGVPAGRCPSRHRLATVLLAAGAGFLVAMLSGPSTCPNRVVSDGVPGAISTLAPPATSAPPSTSRVRPPLRQDVRSRSRDATHDAKRRQPGKAKRSK